MWHLEQDIAVITIDNPPVNASSHAVREGLLVAIDAIAARDDIRGVILIGARQTFIAGSDLREFGAPLADPQLPAVISALEDLSIPVVAAIEGVALGGGLELALGCDYRVATADAKLGLPEVSLGLVPGAGGTQRLPRAVGMLDALDLVVSSRRIEGSKAHRMGLVDRLAHPDVLATALDLLKSGVPKRLLRHAEIAAFDSDEANQLKSKLLKKARHRPAAVKAADLTLMAAQMPFANAILEERSAFQNIRISPEAFAYRHVFFAEREAARGPDTQAPKIERVGVIGLGTMGVGIAYSLAQAGLNAIAVEASDEQLANGVDRFEALIADGLTKGRLSEETAEAIRARFSGHHNLGAAAQCDLVIEAVFEDIYIKRAVLKNLSEAVSPSTLIASNTSYLDLDLLADAVSNPDRFFGLHFFSPAHIMKLLEVVRAEASGDRAIAAGMRLARKLAKQPVIARNGYGFVGNRIYAAYRRHAEFLVEDGSAIEDVDAAMVELGMAMGPFMVADLSGLDIAWRMRKAQAATRDPSDRYVAIPDVLCEMGRFGRKTGAGYYNYANGKPEVDPLVSSVIASERDKKAIAPHRASIKDIQARCVGAMVNEAALVLSEGIAARPGDIDVTLIHGYGFPRWLGGPLWYAAQQPAQWVDDALREIARAEGSGGRQGPVRALLSTLSTVHAN